MRHGIDGQRNRKETWPGLESGLSQLRDASPGRPGPSFAKRSPWLGGPGAAKAHAWADREVGMNVTCGNCGDRIPEYEALPVGDDWACSDECLEKIREREEEKDAER